MRLTFLGTRGYIDERSPRHNRHSAVLVERNGERLMIDCGLDWQDELGRIAPQSLLLTHAHPDHTGGLKKGVPCPVFATAETWKMLEDVPVTEQGTVNPGVPFELCGLKVTAVAVDHSLRAPAVGYRLEGGQSSIFYAPDVANLPRPHQVLEGIDLFIGDGTAGTGSLLRVEEDRLCGHAPLATQLNWCRKAGVPRMLVTHCGRELVLEEDKGTLDQINALSAEFDIAVDIAYDGMQLILP
ncbi:MAG: MBL fold metallo-hydrolase [Desulfuromonadales bacterium]